MRQAAARLVKLTQDEEAAALRELARQSMPQMPRIDEAYRIGPSKRWFAVYTHPRCEKKVIEGLERQNVIGYMPVGTNWQRQSQRQKHQRGPKRRVERPVWPRYVFVALPVEMRVQDGFETLHAPFELLRTTDGVSDIVGDGVKPVHIPAVAIDALREQEARGEFDETRKTGRVLAPKWLKVGTTVRIEEGAFRSFNGLVEEILPREMVKACVFIFGRATPVIIEIDRIKPL
jgi:transcription antitermination factor NusG